MKVTVVIPTYNRAGYLPPAIQSVLQQTFTDLELIVVDDGSTDNTADVMRDLPHVSYVRTEHRGLAHARNTGMRLARGEYVTFLDSDDLLYPYKLAVQVLLLDSHPDVSMVYTECSSFSDDGEGERFHLRTYHSGYRDPSLTYDRIFQRSVDLAERGWLPAGEADLVGRRAYFGNIFDVYLRNIIVFHNSLMIRRSVVAEIGYHDETLLFFLEMDWLLRLCRKHPVAFMDLPTYKIRSHATQMSSTTGADGGYIAVQKQHCLLRVIRRHIGADPAYYERHKAELDRYLARLNRSVAVPLLVCGPGRSRTRAGYPRRGRLFLARARELRRPDLGLWWASFLPLPLRRVAVGLLGHREQRRRQRAARARALPPSGAPMRIAHAVSHDGDRA